MPTEKIVVENNETANLSYLMEDITSLYKEMGSLLKRLGEIEKKNPDIMEKMKQFSSPEVLERFVENRSMLIRLEEAYISSRYMARVYERDEAEELVNFAEKVIEFVKSAKG